MRSVLSLTSVLIAIAALTISSNAAAQTAPANETAAALQGLEQFKPNPKNQLQIDYQVWDGILNNMVFLTGLSTRQAAPRPEALTGGRLVFEHTSPYRREGNKIPFSLLKQEHVETLRAYKDDLEQLGGQINIAELPKKEQLAYWLNLHNLTVILMIAENYPVYQPNDLLIGPEKAAFQDAKVIAVNGTRLSLRDIREQIVFPNWDNPIVVYGFFMGDIGSPTVQSQAFTADNVDKLLRSNADEFINSLRSFNRGRISKIYQDVSRFYFPNFETDLRKHFALYMWEDVLAELAATEKLKIAGYEYAIADMEGGRGGFVVGNVTIANDPDAPGGRPVRSSQSYAIASFTNQIVAKSRVLLRQGKIKRGVVIVGEESDEKSESADDSKNRPTNPPE